MGHRRIAASVAAGLVLAAGLGACSGTDAPRLRLGYFPNLTHAAALVGIGEGLFEQELGEDVGLVTTAFNSGTEATEAILSGAIDASYIGPGPAINGYAASISDGGAIRIVAGATSGGASLVVADGIDAPADLEGTTLATPSLGNTQDVALRAWLAEQGFETTLEGGGDVAITPLANADALTAFASGNIDGAWVPEPYATRMVQESGGHVLLDERELWPDGDFVTTQLIVATSYLEEHPDRVRALLVAHRDATDLLNDEPERAKTIVNAQLEELSGSALAPAVLDEAWERMRFTLDPIASSLRTGAEHAIAVELLEPVDLDGIYDLTLLNEILVAAGEPEVTT